MDTSEKQAGMGTVNEVAATGAAAQRAGELIGAAAAWRRLVFAEPGNPAWRLRLAAALGAGPAPDAESLELMALQQLDAALVSGKPLVALLCALAVPGTDPGALMADYLAESSNASGLSADGRSPRLGKAARLSPPLTRAPGQPCPPVAPDAPLPDAPESPVAGPLPPMPLLSLLDADALRAIAPHLSRRALDPGEVLMAEGEAADALYLVAHGVLDITKDDPDRPSVKLGTVADGAVLGEMALVLSKPRSATVTAVTEVEAVRLEVAALRAVAEHEPAVQQALSDFTRQRVIQMLLTTSPLFRDLDPPARAALLRVFGVRELPDNTVITRQGGEGKALRVVVHGGVDIWRSEEGETPARIARLGPGQVFGEIALLTGQPATATVVTVGATTVLELHRNVLDEVCTEHPGIAERLTRISEERLAENRFIFQDDDFFEDAE